MINLPVTPGLTKLLDEIMSIAPGLTPESIVGSHWPNGHWRRIRASYSNGWDLIVNLDKKGNISSSRGTVRLSCASRAVA